MSFQLSSGGIVYFHSYEITHNVDTIVAEISCNIEKKNNVDSLNYEGNNLVTRRKINFDFFIFPLLREFPVIVRKSNKLKEFRKSFLYFHKEILQI